MTTIFKDQETSYICPICGPGCNPISWARNDLIVDTALSAHNRGKCSYEAALIAAVVHLVREKEMSLRRIDKLRSMLREQLDEAKVESVASRMVVCQSAQACPFPCWGGHRTPHQERDDCHSCRCPNCEPVEGAQQ